MEVGEADLERNRVRMASPVEWGREAAMCKGVQPEESAGSGSKAWERVERVGEERRLRRRVTVGRDAEVTAQWSGRRSSASWRRASLGLAFRSDSATAVFPSRAAAWMAYFPSGGSMFGRVVLTGLGGHGDVNDGSFIVFLLCRLSGGTMCIDILNHSQAHVLPT